MTRQDFIIIYLSISLFAIQYLWMKDAKQAAYQQGRSEVLEVMAEMNYEAMPYMSKKGHTK